MDRLPARDPLVEDVHYAAERWADAIWAVACASGDPATLEKWARLIHVSVPTLRSRCYAAGISPKRSLDIARLLRICLHAAPDCSPTDLLDAKDQRTIRALLSRAGVPHMGERDRWLDPATFLDSQLLVSGRWLLVALKQKLKQESARQRRS
jgi:hypothetical protein